jgi:hypothetical protein
VSLHVRILAGFALVLGLSAPAVHAAVTAEVPAKFEAGKIVYRKFCGHCHALKEARAVGFGAARKLGPGEDGGPSFDPLKVPYELSVLAVTGTWDGHDRIAKKMTWKQTHDVALFVQAATKDHRHLAELPSDAFLTPTR